MSELVYATMPRAAKGPVAPPPALEGDLAAVAANVTGWPGVVATVHWDLYDTSRVDGVDFYVGDDELGHLHLDGSIHLATPPSVGRTLVDGGLARPFPYARGWVCETVRRIGVDAATALFRLNYERIAGLETTPA